MEMQKSYHLFYQEFHHGLVALEKSLLLLGKRVSQLCRCRRSVQLSTSQIEMSLIKISWNCLEFPVQYENFYGVPV